MYRKHEKSGTLDFLPAERFFVHRIAGLQSHWFVRHIPAECYGPLGAAQDLLVDFLCGSIRRVMACSGTARRILVLVADVLCCLVLVLLADVLYSAILVLLLNCLSNSRAAQFALSWTSQELLVGFLCWLPMSCAA